ncbi:hypothetical protein Tco_1408952 [Tanacetum coccineum]
MFEARPFLKCAAPVSFVFTRTLLSTSFDQRSTIAEYFSNFSRINIPVFQRQCRCYIIRQKRRQRHIIAFADADHAGCQDTRRSTSGSMQLLEHPSDTKVFTMKMEILLEPTSNKLIVGTFKDGDGDTLFQYNQLSNAKKSVSISSPNDTISQEAKESQDDD